MSAWWFAVPIGMAVVGGALARCAWSCLIRRAIDKRDKRDKCELRDSSKPDAQTAGEQVRYHNSAIYDDLRFFIKVSLAIVAGAATVYFTDYSWSAIAPMARPILIAAGLLELIVGTVLFLSVLSHQEAKIIKWWCKPPETEDVPYWQETRIVPILVGTASGLAGFIWLLTTRF